MKKWINIIKLSGELHALPFLHDSYDEAVEGMEGVLGKYRTPHLEFVTMPIGIEIPGASDTDGSESTEETGS